jgi:hypothetical protein
VDDEFRRQRVATREARLAGRAAHAGGDFHQVPALGQQARAGRAMDRAVDPAAAQQSRLRSDDDGVHRQVRYVALDHFNTNAADTGAFIIPM